MTYLDLLNEIRAEFPTFQVRPKEGSRLMEVIDLLLLVLTFGQMRAFMTGFITTIGTTVYVPAGWDSKPEWSRLEVLRHERVHMRQARRYGQLWFSFLYLACPLPLGLAWFRARFEQEAYEESMRALVEYRGPIALDARHRAFVVGLFCGPAYGWMWPFRRSVERWYDEARARILSGSL